MAEVARRLPVVAIDGPAGAGKSAVSKRLALTLGYRLLDTGALYRSVAFLAKDRGIHWENEHEVAEIAAAVDVEFLLRDEVNHLRVNNVELTELIRSPEISFGASIVSTHVEVRAALLTIQRDLGRKGGLVAEGRDVGTVVFPDAEVKFFLTASDEVRAQRRCAELQAMGVEADVADTRAEMRERDERDSGRQVSPLIQAADAVLVDSSNRGLDEVIRQMLTLVRAAETSLDEGAPTI